MSRGVFLPQICNQNKALKPESHKSQVCTKKCVLYQAQSFLTTKALWTGWRDSLASQLCPAAKPVRIMSRCSLWSFRQCPTIVRKAEELKGRSFRGRVVAQTKQITVLFDILPKVHNWNKKLWPVRNPGCGGKCFLGWGKQASRPVSCLGHGWANTWPLAEKWLWWEVFCMDSYLMMFRITQILLVWDFSRNLFLRDVRIILWNQSCWCFGTSKVSLRRLKFSKPHKHNPAWHWVHWWGDKSFSGMCNSYWIKIIQHERFQKQSFSICCQCAVYTAQGCAYMRAKVDV